ncbi:MAG: metallophosphoesterase [Candidatus Brocadiales bacterium]
MMKIIHLTDLHIGEDAGGHSGEEESCIKVFDNIVGNIIKTIKDRASEYVVVITGDLVHVAFIDENYEMAKTAIGRLREAFKQEVPEQDNFDHVLVIPGNHDYGRGIYVKERYVKKFKKTFFGNTEVTYPKYDPTDKIAFIGLDSMAESFFKGNGWWADGKLGDTQLDGLDQKLKKATVDEKHIVVYLHHHPFKQLDDVVHGNHFHGLKDHDKLIKKLKKHNKEHKNIRALLFGHNHEGEDRWRGRLGIPRCYDGGTSTGVGGVSVSPHRVFDLEDENGDYIGGMFYRP